MPNDVSRDVLKRKGSRTRIYPLTNKAGEEASTREERSAFLNGGKGTHSVYDEGERESLGGGGGGGGVELSKALLAFSRKGG